MERASAGVRFFPGFLALAGSALVVALGGCGRPVAALCNDTTDCDEGTSCSAGVCVDGSGGCTTDLDCDPSNAEICQAGVCVEGTLEANNSGGSCSATAECPTTQFCNTATGVCAALLEGWCRLDSQCSGDATLCSNKSGGGQDVPGRCVECITDDDCGGATCVSPGVCDEAPCGLHASAVAGGGCRCDAGYTDNGADLCVLLSAGGEGEGEAAEGEGEAAEGEGEASSGCVDALECFDSHDINWTCDTGSGQCICDEPWLQDLCGADYDLGACACGGGGGGGGGTSLMANQECFGDTDCDGLACIFSVAASGLFDPGYCKEVCSSNADCGGGLTCMDGVFADGSGICADVGSPGNSCESSIYQMNIGTDALCDGGSSGILDCFSNQCEQVCDWEGNTGSPETCMAGSCGSLSFRAEAGANIAVCN